MDVFVAWAEVIGALATAGALIFVAINTKHSSRALKEAERMRQLEMQRDEIAQVARDRHQASKVVAWPVKGHVDGQFQWGLELVNASDVPVFELSVARPGGVTSRKGTPIPGIHAVAKVLPPGRYFVNEKQGWPIHIGPELVLTPVPGNAGYMASVSFLDSDGRSWCRTAEGKVEAAAPANSEQ